jgi:hypothetical protein
MTTMGFFGLRPGRYSLSDYLAGREINYHKNEPFMVNFKFAYQHSQSWQPEMHLDCSGTKIIQIFIVTNRFSHSWLRRPVDVKWNK